MTGSSVQISPLSAVCWSGCSKSLEGSARGWGWVRGNSAATGGANVEGEKEFKFSVLLGVEGCVSSNPPDCAKPGIGDVRNWKETGCKE